MTYTSNFTGHADDAEREAEVLAILADAARRIDAVAGNELLSSSATSLHHGNIGSLRDYRGAEAEG